jgi:hypothetical protein
VDPNVHISRPENNGCEARQTVPLHPAWLEFIRFCRELRHGDINQLRIQDGLPVLAETVTRKVKFTRP